MAAEAETADDDDDDDVVYGGQEKKQILSFLSTANVYHLSRVKVSAIPEI